jgi:hypothetical protein
VGKLSIEDLGFRFEDQSTQPSAVQEIEGFSLLGQELTNEPNKKGKIALKGKVNKKGSLAVDGSLQFTRWMWQSSSKQSPFLCCRWSHILASF